jgi:hypothetical protein
VPAVDAVQVPQKYPTALIYVDESAVKASAGRFFVVGAVKVRRPGQLMRVVRDIRDRHGFRDEFKFSRISRGKFPVFCELIDAIEQSDAHIAACVVDRDKGTDPFAGNSAEWFVHARITAKLLVGILNRRELASVLLDEISTPMGCAFDDTVRDIRSPGIIYGYGQSFGLTAVHRGRSFGLTATGASYTNAARAPHGNVGCLLLCRLSCRLSPSRGAEPRLARVGRRCGNRRRR